MSGFPSVRSVDGINQKEDDPLALFLKVIFSTEVLQDTPRQALLAGTIMGVGSLLGDAVIDARPARSAVHSFALSQRLYETHAVHAGEEAGITEIANDRGDIRLEMRRGLATRVGADEMMVSGEQLGDLQRIITTIRQGAEHSIDSLATIMWTKAALQNARLASGRVIHGPGKRVTRTGADIPTAYPSSDTGAASLVDDMGALGLQFTEDENTVNRRMAMFHPYLLERVAPKDETLFDMTLNSGVELGAITRSDARLISNFQAIRSTTHLPDAVVSESTFKLGSSVPEKYHGDFRPTSVNGQPAVLAVASDALRKPVGAIVLDPGTLIIERRRHAIDIEMSLAFGMDVMFWSTAGGIFVGTQFS